MHAPRDKPILVLGLGNTLLSDDGVGVHIVHRLSSDPATPPWLRAIDGGTMGFRLTTLLADADDVLLIDAADIAAPPGTIRLLDAGTLFAHAAGAKKTSAHEAGLAGLLGLMRLEHLSPRHMALLGIQPLVIGWGETLSAPVANAVVPACELAITTVTAWRA